MVVVWLVSAWAALEMLWLQRPELRTVVLEQLQAGRQPRRPQAIP